MTFESAGFNEGRIFSGGVHYYLKDHLGSVRAVLDQAGAVKEQNDYYPFGLRQERSDYALLAGNHFKYNGKEEQPTGNLGYLDYGARMYDAGLGRWFGADPLAEAYYSLSPYAYCAGNPLSFVDPIGMWIDDYQLHSNGIIYFLNLTDDNFDRLYAFGPDGLLDKENFLKMDKGILDNELFGKDSKGHDYTYYSFKDDEASDAFFYFVADHTEVEWSQVKYGMKSSYISTAYNETRGYGGADLLYHLLKDNYTVRMHMHSHPFQNTNKDWFLPSGYAENDQVKDGDKAFVNWFYRYYPEKAVSMRWMLYDVTTSHKLSYGKMGAWGYNRKTKKDRYFKY